MTYGYIRVSTQIQNIDRQTDAFQEYQVPEKNIFTDKQSGKNFVRPSYRKLMKKLHKGDVLIVKSIDRLGRNYKEILEQWRIITKEKEADIVVIDMPLLDTRVKEKDITGTFVADLVLQILAYVADTERKFILQRQKEGIESAKKRGVRFGWPVMERPENFEEIRNLWLTNKISAREAGRRLNVDPKTFRKWREM